MTAFVNPYRQGVLDDACVSLRRGATANGYPFDVAPGSVSQDESNLLVLSPDRPLPVFIVQPTDKGTMAYFPSKQMTEDFVIAVTARMDAQDSSDYDRKTKVGEKLFAFIEMALTDDFGGYVDSGITRGGNCVDTKLVSKQMLQSVGPDNIVIVVVLAKCKIYRTYGRPAGP